MDDVELDLLAGELDALQAALDAERGRHVAGLEPEPSLARLFAARPRVAHRDAVAAFRAAGREPLALRAAALRAERAAAEAEERWHAAASAATGIGPDGPAPLATLELALVREPDRERRRAFARAAAEAEEPAAAAREAAAEARARARAEGGLAPDWPIVVAGDEALAASDDAWADVLAFSVRRELGLAPRPGGDLERADLVHLLALSRWDGLFRAGDRSAALRAAAAPLGVDLGRVHVDEGNRSAQWPGVHVHGDRLSFRARGGAGDWQDLAEGLARAAAAVVAPPRRREPALGAALGWLVGSLLLEPRFLADHAGVERRQAADVVRDLALRRLLGLRLSAAALRVATEVERGLSGAAWREAHRDALSAASGAAWELVRAARDSDAPALAARLAGAAAGEGLRRHVRERYDEDWWRNPRTRPFLAGLLAAGALPEAGAEAPAAADAARALVAKLEGRNG